MRVYLPTTFAGLARALSEGEVAGPESGGLLAHAVTPALREWYAEGDEEELEYAALTDAARASLGLLGPAPVEVPRRVVLAADVDDAAARPDVAAGRSAVRLTAPVPWRRLASVHVDDADAAADVRAAVAALPAAEAGDDDAQFAVDAVEDHELLWYATQEVAELLDRVGRRG
ncbi:MAG: DUF6912 family protein [Motilibacteraceae bacterium]